MISNQPDRRNHTRTAVRQPALVVLNNGLSRIEATMLDVSISGAKLEIEDAVDLQPMFYMLLPNHRLQPCRLAWRRGMYAGVCYEG